MVATADRCEERTRRIVMELLLFSGLPASGKTTAAVAWVAEDPTGRVRVNYDDLRMGMFGEGWKFNHHDENKMKTEASRQAREALTSGKSVVIDNTNLTARAKAQWRSFAQAFGATVIEEEFDTPVATCVERDRKRVGKQRVGQAVIDWMALTRGFIDWSDRELYPRDFIIVDLDGTLANGEHREHYLQPKHEDTCEGSEHEPCKCKLKKDWKSYLEACHLDDPIRPIFKLVELLSQTFDVLIVSGRSMDSCGIKTEDWLLKYQGTNLHRHLFMRRGQDYRPDYEVKMEILDYLPKDRIRYVIDDRPVVLRAWQAAGLTTLAVGDLKEF